jgi:hypothetical protein
MGALGAVVFLAGGTVAVALQGAYPVADSSIVESATQEKAITAAVAAATSALQRSCDRYANLHENGTVLGVKRVLMQAHPEVGGVLVTVRLSGSCIVSAATPIPGAFRPAPATYAAPPAPHSHSNRPGATPNRNPNGNNGNVNNGKGNNANGNNANGNNANGVNNGNGANNRNRGNNGNNGNGNTGNGGDVNGDNGNGRQQ